MRMGYRRESLSPRNWAALFGLATYATYDLTNQSTLKQWPTLLTVVDLLWGTALSAFAASVGRWAATYVLPPTV